MKANQLGAFAPLLVLSLAFGAQEGTHGKQQQDPRARQGETARPGDVTARPMQGMQGGALIDAKRVVGIKVTNPQGEDLGKLDDLVVDQSGRVQYAVLSFGGWLGMGDKLFAIPWQCLDPRFEGQAAAGGQGAGGAAGQRAGERLEGLVLNVEKERLKGAPGFDKDAWPTMANQKWCAEVDTYFAEDVRRTGRPVEASARMGAGAAVLRISDLRGHDVVGQQGDDIGEVERIVIDPASGRTSFVVLSAGGFLGMGDDKVAVPFEALRIAPEKVQGGDTGRAGKVEEFKVTLNIDAEKLKSAPKFDENRAYDQAYAAQLYSHYGLQQPMGSHRMGGERGMGDDPMRKDPLRKDDPMKKKKDDGLEKDS